MLIDKPNDFSHKDLSFDEVDEGFTAREAVEEAKRCLNCAKPMCRTGCPIDNEIPDFLKALSKGNVGEASEIIARRSNLPAVCGRVCPHEKQCEAHCVLAKRNAGIRIGKLERFIADFAAEMNLDREAAPGSQTGNVAVIGSGPAGLTVAGDLAKRGIHVTVFDAQTEPGGVLMYGIPEFRLPKEVVRRETRKIEKLGVTFKTNVLVGPDITVDQLFQQEFDAIFIGTGTALPRTLEIPGKDLAGVMQAMYLLSTVNLSMCGKLGTREIPINSGDHVVVIGAGNVAMDAARSALRMGAAKVSVMYHRTEKQMTALKTEYEHAVAEGIQFIFLANAVKFLGQGFISGLQYEVQKIDDTGHVSGTGQYETIGTDKVILAIGQRPAARIVSTTKGIEVNEKGYVITRERPYGMTTRTGVFAGGDVVHEPATVVLAMKEAKKVAAGIAAYVNAKKLMEDCSLHIID